MLPPGLPDYHVHTFRCGHAGGSSREFVKAAIARGLSEIAFTDHIPLYFLATGKRDPRLAMAEEELEGYVSEVRQLAQEFRGRITVRLGLEADFAEGCEELLASWLARADWDLVLGSVHHVAGDWIDSPGAPQRFEREGADRLYREYYRLLGQAAETGLFDVLAHFDLPKKFGHRPADPMEREEERAIEAAARAGCAVEVSSAGLRKPVGEIYPEARLLRRLVARQVPITFSSDAHAPAEVGWGYDELLEHARDCGATQYVQFEGRKKIFQPLPAT